MALTDVKLKMNDVDGQAFSSTFHMAAGVDPTSLAALTSAIDGISGGGITGIQAAYHESTALSDAVVSPYGEASDKLELDYEGAQGSLVTVSIPAPAAECFLADGETVDMSFCGTQIDAIKDNITDTSGGAVTFLRGRRTWKRRKQG